MAVLGFNWEYGEPSRVQELFSKANLLGFYGPDDIRQIEVQPQLPVLDVSGQFLSLALGLRDARDLAFPSPWFPLLSVPFRTKNWQSNFLPMLPIVCSNQRRAVPEWPTGLRRFVGYSTSRAQTKRGLNASNPPEA